MGRPSLDTQYELDGDPSDNRDALEGPPARRRWGSRFLAFVLAAAAVYAAVRGFQRYSVTSEELNELSAMASAPEPRKPSRDDLGGLDPEAVVAKWTQQNNERLAADKLHLWAAYGMMLLCPAGLGCACVVWWRGQFKRPKGAAVLDPAQLSVAVSTVLLLAAVRGFDSYTLMQLNRMPAAMDLRTAFHEARESRKVERYAILKEKFEAYAAKVKDKSLKPTTRLEATRQLHALVSRREFPDICPEAERPAVVSAIRECISANYSDDAVCTLLVRAVGAAGAVAEMAEVSAEREKTKANWVDVKSEAGLRVLRNAVVAGDEASVRTLINRGITLNVLLPGEGRTALHEAVAQKNSKIAKLLLDGRARSDIAGRFGMPRAIREFPLHRAVSVGDAALVTLLLDRGANPNVPDDGGMTPLHRAAASGDVASAKALLAKKATINRLDKGGRTPQDVAEQVCAADKRPAIRDLLEKHGGLTASKLPPPPRPGAVATTPQQ
jgi:hypothetical protein